MPDDLTTAAGIAALAAGGVAILALLLALVLFAKLRRVRSAQTAVLGTSGERDLVTHAEGLEIAFVELRELVESTFSQVQQRLEADENRIARGISRTAVIRYDAYGEMSGRQSSSMALLDDNGTGVVLSSHSGACWRCSVSRSRRAPEQTARSLRNLLPPRRCG